MTTTFWMVYQGTSINNVVALFRQQNDANTYAATNPEYVVVRAEIEVPFNAYPAQLVTPV